MKELSWGKAAWYAFLILVAWKSTLHILRNNIRSNGADSIEMYEGVLKQNDVLFPRVAICQNVLETGMFSSKVYKENHNPFGMRESSRKFDIGSLNKHANYPHEDHPGKCTVDCYIPAIKDYAAWQKAFNVARNCSSDEDYIYYLQHLPGGRRYAEDKGYANKIRIIYKTLYSQ